MTDYINEFCMHDATCGELRKSDVGREVTLCGWAWHNRDHGGLIFCDLRDRTGYTQVVVDPDCVSEEDFHKAEHLGREYALQITGTVRDRGADAVNPNMATHHERLVKLDQAKALLAQFGGEPFGGEHASIEDVFAGEE